MHSFIDGLTIIDDFITSNEENRLLEIIKNISWNGTLLRKSRHYGYNYNYKTKSITKDDYLGKLPEWINEYLDRMMQRGFINEYPNQMTINRYLPGEGISAHIDVPEIFGNDLFSISIGSGCNMIFRKNDDIREYYIKQRAFMLIKNTARYEYTHSIKKTKIDTVRGNSIPRNTRYSLTFRTVVI